MTMTTETVRDVADEIDDDHVHERADGLWTTEPVPPALARHITGAYRRIDMRKIDKETRARQRRTQGT